MIWLKKLASIWGSCNVWILLFLGFSSGLPLAITSSTLQAWLTTRGVSIVDIGMFSLVGLPYIYKFLWSLLLDRFTPPWLGRRRGWILLMQLCLLISIFLMPILGDSSLWILAVLALLIAFFSASQYIAIDAYRTDLLHKEERGVGTAIFIGGWRLGALLSGGLALIIANYLGWRSTYFLLALLMFIGIITTFRAPLPFYEKAAPLTLYEAVIMPFKDFLTRAYAIWILIFILLYKFADSFALALMSTFLLRGIGFNLVEVGAVFKVFGVLAIVLGTLVGGSLIPYLKLFKSLLIFGFLQALSNLLFMWLAIVGKHYCLFVIAVMIDSFTSGMSTTVFVVFLMALCNHHYTATQFALLSAVSALARVLIGPFAGLFVVHFGWGIFFLWSFILGLPSLILLIYLNTKLNFNSESISRRSF